jgi:hypothetical protein
MFNRLKKRVKDVQENRSKGRTAQLNHQLDSDLIPRNSNSTSATDVAYNLASAAKVALEKQAIRSKASVNRRTSHYFTDETTDHFIDPLSRFHGCIEASDALAATSYNSANTSASGDSKVILPVRVDQDTGLADCSVLVSPDGDLLLIPQGENQVRAHANGIKQFDNIILILSFLHRTEKHFTQATTK